MSDAEASESRQHVRPDEADGLSAKKHGGDLAPADQFIDRALVGQVQPLAQLLLVQQLLALIVFVVLRRH